MEESQYDLEEGCSYKSREQMSKDIVLSNHDKPSTSKQSPIKNEETQSSTEDIR